MYSTVQAQNPDGTYGTYQRFDSVATFVEAQNEKLATAGYVKVGWDPMVTANIASYDGGKVLFGFGKVRLNLNAGWIIKMWGTTAPSG